MSGDGVLSSSKDQSPSSSKEQSQASSTDRGRGHSERQPIAYCPYCSEETLFPREGGGWECRSCLRAFSVSFLGLVGADGGAQS